MTTQDEAIRRAALTRLAVAVRERLPEHKDDRAAFFRVFLDDHEKFPTRVFVEACRRLETKLEWFPKKAELYDECGLVARQQAEQHEAQQRRTALPPPASPERHAQFLAQLKALTRTKRMR
jgi:hypothetical protein